jgi:hypothetical protein
MPTSTSMDATAQPIVLGLSDVALSRPVTIASLLVTL